MSTPDPDYDWWIAHAHEDSAFLTLMQSRDYFLVLVKRRAEQVGRTDVQGVINQATYRACFEQDRFGSLASVLEGITPPLVVSAHDPDPELTTTDRPFRGPVRTDRKALRDDLGPRPMAGVTAFWAPWAFRASSDDLYGVRPDGEEGRDQIAALGEWARRGGFTYCRWLGASDWVGGTDPSSVANYYDTMSDLIEALAQAGLRSQITLFSRRKMIPDPVGAAREWAAVVNAHRDHVCLVECVNEWNHADNDWSDREVRQVGDSFRAHCEAPLAYSGAAGATWAEQERRLHDLYSLGRADVCTIHLPRRQDTSEGAWRWVRQAWHTRHISGAPAVRVDNEHQRWDRSRTGRQVSLAVASLVNAFVSGCAMSCHHDLYGVRPDRGHMQSMTSERGERLLKALRAILELLPPDLPNWQSVRVGPGGGPHPFPSLLSQHWTFDSDLQAGVSRAYASVRGHRLVMVLSGVRERVMVPEYTHAYRVQSCETGETVYAGAGPVTLSADDVPAEAEGAAFVVTCL